MAENALRPRSLAWYVDAHTRIDAAREAGRDHEADVAHDTLLEFEQGSATAPQVEAALVDCDHGMIPRHEPMDVRVLEAIEKADQAFWEVVRWNFPEVVTGDLPPDVGASRVDDNARVVRTWLNLNREGGSRD